MSVAQSLFPVLNFWLFWMFFGEAVANSLMLLLQSSEKPAQIQKNKACYIFMILFLSCGIYAGVYNGVTSLMETSAFEAEEHLEADDGTLFYRDDNYNHHIELNLQYFK